MRRHEIGSGPFEKSLGTLGDLISKGILDEGENLTSGSPEDRAKALREINIFMRTGVDGGSTPALVMYEKRLPDTTLRRPFFKLSPWSKDINPAKTRNEMRILIRNLEPGLALKGCIENQEDPSPVQTIYKARGESLTPRETEILMLASKGGTRRDIADQLDIKTNTVTSHFRTICRKLGLDTIQKAVAPIIAQRTQAQIADTAEAA